MIRCITAHQLWERYGVVLPPGNVYQSTNSWRLVVTSLDETSPVSRSSLLICLGNLHTLVALNDTLCFNLADIFRGKLFSQHWLQLIAIVFSRLTRVRIFYKQTYTFGKSITVLEAISIVHNWSYINMNDLCVVLHGRQDRSAIFEYRTGPLDKNLNYTTGRWLITQPKIRPNRLPWISYGNTSILQASNTVVLCYPANLVSYSAMTRCVIREDGQEI